MPNLGLDRYIVFIANITDRDIVTINCFLFQIKNGQKLSVQPGKFEILPGNSPLRRNVKVLENAYRGAESFNAIPNYEKVINYQTASVQRENSYSPNRRAGRNTYAKQPISNKTGFTQPVHTNDKDTEYNTTTRRGQQLVKVKSSEIKNEKNTIKPENDKKRDKVSGSQNHFFQGNANFSGVGEVSTTQTLNGTGKECESDINQTIVQAINIAKDNGNSNYELTPRAKEMVKTKRTSPSNCTLQNFPGPKINDQYNKQYILNQREKVDITWSPDHQKNADQISHETTEVKCTRQIGATVEYLGGQTITKQPSGSRNSLYDNIEKSEVPPTPMDTDEVEPISDTEIRPNTPSATFQGATISPPNDNEVDENDGLGGLCGMFAAMKLCGSSK